MYLWHISSAFFIFILIVGSVKVNFLSYRYRADKSTIFGMRYCWTYMSAILDFYDVYQFETYINGFLDLEYPNFDPKHGFLV